MKTLNAFCDICQKQLSIEVPVDIAKNRDYYPFEYLHIHGDPSHASMLYLDEKLNVRDVIALKDIKIDDKTTQNIAELEKKTRFLMDNQIKEITTQIQVIGIAINEKLDKLRLGVLQRSINNLVQGVFSGRIEKITESMNTQFDVELRKVIMEKFIVQELGNLKENILFFMKSNDFENAQPKWTKAKEILKDIKNPTIKAQWQIFENEYIMKKFSVSNEQRVNTDLLNNLQIQIMQDVLAKNFALAASKLQEAKKISGIITDPSIKQKWKEFETNYVECIKNQNLVRPGVSDLEFLIQILPDIKAKFEKLGISVPELINKTINEAVK